MFVIQIFLCYCTETSVSLITSESSQLAFALLLSCSSMKQKWWISHWYPKRKQNHIVIVASILVFVLSLNLLLTLQNVGTPITKSLVQKQIKYHKR